MRRSTHQLTKNDVKIRRVLKLHNSLNSILVLYGFSTRADAYWILRENSCSFQNKNTHETKGLLNFFR